eukprot:CAMPEP_0196726290 /NCGR_PEP_ID=MMETSP1091-20130531/7601_1 /TAXON_ID=302021 /ORGANISM="Rhodomonas sp., Strain CCMP768" /LENGTH=104 /DNA_ID=CAMNT_0042068703 /DNA_START=180 /DNA_END=491 /DNA_ORIENTATION=+
MRKDILKRRASKASVLQLRVRAHIAPARVVPGVGAEGGPERGRDRVSGVRRTEPGAPSLVVGRALALVLDLLVGGAVLDVKHTPARPCTDDSMEKKKNDQKKEW